MHIPWKIVMVSQQVSGQFMGRMVGTAIKQVRAEGLEYQTEGSSFYLGDRTIGFSSSKKTKDNFRKTHLRAETKRSVLQLLFISGMRKVCFRTEAVREERVTHERPSVLEKQNQQNKYAKRFIIRNWFMWIWKLTRPKICKLETQESSGGKFPSEGEQGQGTGRINVLVQVQKQEQTEVPVGRQSGRRGSLLLLDGQAFYYLGLHHI